MTPGEFLTKLDALSTKSNDTITITFPDSGCRVHYQRDGHDYDMRMLLPDNWDDLFDKIFRAIEIRTFDVAKR